MEQDKKGINGGRNRLDQKRSEQRMKPVTFAYDPDFYCSLIKSWRELNPRPKPRDPQLKWDLWTIEEQRANAYFWRISQRPETNEKGGEPKKMDERGFRTISLIA
jgi:hypothetical protein